MTITETMTDEDLTGADTHDGLPTRLWGYATIHDAIRRDTGRLPAALGRVRHRADVDQMIAWMGLFETAIVHHHEREDDLIFPLLAQRFGFDPRALTGEHQVLDELFAELGGAINEIRATSTAGTAPSEHWNRHAVAVARDLDEVMVRHLKVEELAVFPLVTERLEVQEWQAVEREIQKGTSLRDAVFGLPWALEGANPAYVAHVLDGVPFPFRVVNALFWQRGYDRAAAQLQGVVS